MTTPTQAEVDQAARDLEKAQRDYELAVQSLSSLPSIATHERAALIQWKVNAWNALEEARRKFADVHTRAARFGVVKF